jgi:hypothetical protein
MFSYAGVCFSTVLIFAPLPVFMTVFMQGLGLHVDSYGYGVCHSAGLALPSQQRNGFTIPGYHSQLYQYAVCELISYHVVFTFVIA